MSASSGEVHVEAEGRLYIGASATAEAFMRVLAASHDRGLPVRIIIDEAFDTFELMATLTVVAKTADLTARFELLERLNAVDLFLSVRTPTADPSHGQRSRVRSPSAPIPDLPVSGMGASNSSNDSIEVSV